jgi:hypothetical protein
MSEVDKDRPSEVAVEASVTIVSEIENLLRRIRRASGVGLSRRKRNPGVRRGWTSPLGRGAPVAPTLLPL